ncbi:ABC transporter permease [Agromyces sp. LHK192]|uniref:ABC transporter permease n=1 Tax=Agromyces sp. LHK192 TaxID=2498704 RepID=UPI000FD731E2|nr:ABC transporter permease [Agromyces sp. LHK192]
MTSEASRRADRLRELPFERSSAASSRSFAGFLRSIREISGQRELLGLLVRRELKARYKDSSLGFLWSLLRPLTMLLIYFVAIGQFLGAARGIPDFAVFVFAGLTIWGLYNEIVIAGTTSIIGNAGLIKKVNLPREIFPLAATGSAIFNFLVQFVVLILATVVIGKVPLDWDLLYVPAGVAIVLVWGIAAALLLSAVNVYLRDVQYLVEVAMLLLFWLSPIVYAWSFVVDAAARTGLAWLTEVYLSNPVTVAVLAFQRGMWVSGSEETMIDGNVVPPQPWPADLDLRLAIMFGIGVVFLIICQRVFQRLQGNFAQEI